MKSTIRLFQLLWASIVFEFFWLSFMIVLTITYFLFAIIDVITWYYKNEVANRTSARLSNGITTRAIKMIIVLILYIIVSNWLTLTPDWSMYEMWIWAIPIAIIFAWNLSELKSLAENLKEMWANDPIITGIPGIIDKVFRLWDELLWNLLDKIAKNLSDRIEKKW